MDHVFVNDSHSQGLWDDLVVQLLPQSTLGLPCAMISRHCQALNIVGGKVLEGQCLADVVGRLGRLGRLGELGDPRPGKTIDLQWVRLRLLA